MSVEFVFVEGWEAVLMDFKMWRKTYMHIWDHLQHKIDLECSHQAYWIERCYA